MRLPMTSTHHHEEQRVSASDSMQQKRSQSERCLLGVILGLSIAIQLVVAPYQGFGRDLQWYLAWGSVFDAHPLTLYTRTGANYPPLTIYIFGAVELLYHSVGSLMGLSKTQLMMPTHDQYAVLWFLAKLPTIAANTGSAWLIYRLARVAASARWALLAALAYALAPSMVLDGAAWGQTDGVPIFFLLLAIVSIQTRRPAWAGVLLGVTLMVKPQPVIFIPILLLYVLVTTGWRDFVRASAAGVITVLVICSPFLVPPHLELLVYYLNTVRSFGLITSDAANLWFLIYGGTQVMYQTPLIGSLTATSIGIVLFAPFYALALALVWRRRSIAALYMASALAAVGFFNLTALQHERYLFQALAFLLLAAIHYHSFLLHFAVASVTVFVNMLVVCSIEGYLAAKDPRFAPMYTFFKQQPHVIFMIAFLNLQLLIGTTASCIAWLRRSSVNPTTGDAISSPSGAHALVGTQHALVGTQSVHGTDETVGSG
jgi:dolichyl-phosphate-mannose-protein mannosyltransferase